MTDSQNTKLISLTQGKFALVDVEDYEMVSQWKWYYRKDGYAARGAYPGKTILMHRVIINPPEDMKVDHINGECSDNRKSNLRICSNTENIRNRKKQVGTSSIYKGVTWSKTNKKWQSQIHTNKRTIFLGHFLSQEAAALAYNMAAIEHFKEFARLNIIPC